MQTLQSGKVVKAAELAAELAILRQRHRIVFTNGCFDLLHPGHVSYLEAARRLGDLLVVGLNSDASIRRLKGAKRPILPETARARLLAGLAAVDFVVIFDEDTPYELIRRVEPDILVKGGDWEPEAIVGRDLVEARGGRVQNLPFVENFSTSSIISTILERYAS
jgi:D-beta-D-heptose 7-phosphate kinase/D-beta-D-heptose 1-phosphate adenosyltransferase